MIVLVLDGLGGETLEDLLNFAFGSVCDQHDFGVSLDPACNTGKGKAGFVHLLGFTLQGDLRVPVDAIIARPPLHVEDEELNVPSDLRGGEANTVGVAHDLEHLLHALFDFIVPLSERFAGLGQGFGRIRDEFH